MSARSAQLKALATRPSQWPRVAAHVATTLLARMRAPAFRAPPAGGDIELALGEHRANDVLDEVRRTSVDATAHRFAALLARPDLADDSYSRSQRIAAAAYLSRLGAAPDAATAAALRTEIDALARRPEFRLQNGGFNNHLLNNYRALALARTQLPAACQPPTLDPALARIGALLSANLGTLFADGRGPVLAEGSLSYELLILRHLVDLAACGSADELPRRAREWLRDAPAYVAQLRWRDRWLLPAIGDLSPDWRRADIVDFLDGVFLCRDTLYRRVWSGALETLGLAPLAPALREN